MEALGRLEVLGEVESGGPDRPHIRGQRPTVAREPLDFLFAQAEFEVWGEDAAGLPSVVSDACHTLVHVGQQTPLVALQASMSQLDT